MEMFQVDRTQHPIGQGGFHSTALHTMRRRVFSMVVDCGSTKPKKCNLLAEAFAARARNHNYLAISHLDNDHINGLEHLRNAGVSFDTVFLPHVDMAKYLQWMTLKVSTQENSEGVIADFSRIATLLYGGYFGQVVIVGGPDGNQNIDRDPPPLENSDANDDRNGLLSRETRLAIDRAKSVKGARLSCSTSLTFDLDWIIRFYSREWKFPKEVASIWNMQILQGLKSVFKKVGAKLSNSEWDDFSRNLKEELKKRADPTLAAEIKDLVLATDPRAAALAKLSNAVANTTVSCKKLLTELYDEFSTLHDYNDASLCVYSGPAERGIGVRRMCFGRRVYSGKLSRPAPDRVTTRAVGWIHTGDANFLDEDGLKGFLDHYIAETPLTSTLVLPHHGSRRSFDRGLANLRQLAASLANPTVFLAPAEPSEGHRHPDSDVILACHQIGDLAIVDNDAGSCYSESLTTEWTWPPYW